MRNNIVKHIFNMCFGQKQHVTRRVTCREWHTLASLVAGKRMVTPALVFLMLSLSFVKVWGQTEITDVAGLNAMTATGSYIITTDIDASDYNNTISDFSGTLTAQAKDDGTFPVIIGLTKPLFNSINGGKVSNIIFKGVNINSTTNANIGAVAGTAKAGSIIYNCGILPTTTVKDDKGNITGFTGSSLSTTTSNEVGSIVGKLQGAARVINCFSYATITGGKNVAGIVGYDANNSTNTNINQENYVETPMVMNCMFYGEITGGTTIRPVYGGKSINNNAINGVNPYNYFRANATFDDNYSDIGNYNRSWPAEEEYLTRFEYYRSILNSNKRLCTYWITGKAYGSENEPTDTDEALIAKWVLDPSIAPYPILKKWGKYPSIINPDPNRTWDPEAMNGSGAWQTRSLADPYRGKSFTNKLSVTVNPGGHAANGVVAKTVNLTITDMDTLNYDYGYYKVQLPYYNEVFGNPASNVHDIRYGGNYKDYVVTGWKITSVNHTGTNSFAANWESGYNFADRECTDKDLFETSGRVFAQGGYYYVPEGVTSITIEAYWGKAVYLHNTGHYIDRVNITNQKADGTRKLGNPFEPSGTLPTTFQSQTVYDDWQNAIQALDEADKTGSGNDEKLSLTVYDQAIVLLSNHQLRNENAEVGTNINNKSGKWYPYTLTSIDQDMDNEPDYCFEFQYRRQWNRDGIQPIRFDFLPVPELGMAVRHGVQQNTIGIFIPQGHFEITETAFMHLMQFEYDGKKDSWMKKVPAPIILNGGHFDQIVVRYTPFNNIQYFLMGGHFRMLCFSPGAHTNRNQTAKLRLCAVNAIGGDYPKFYLSGIYRPDIVPTNVASQGNPHCYTNGGRFGTMAGSGNDKILGDVTFKIDHSVIDEFYGGGINAADPVGGSIDVTIDHSLVTKYCGGPKVGAMTTGKTVTTHATGSTFGNYYGGGNGGTSFYREVGYDGNDHDIPTTIDGWSSIGKIENGIDTRAKYDLFNPLNTITGLAPAYDATKGYHALYEFECFVESNGIGAKPTLRTFTHWAQFGITSTGNTTSILNDCTIKNNFYGGGNLANVNGNVTSTLTNCTIEGNVFGAGFSGRIEPFRVHDKSTTQIPYIDKAGVMHNGKLEYGNTEYTWIHDIPEDWDVSPTTDSPTFPHEGTTYVYTPLDLSNLGTVSGNVTLTIDGSSTVGGSVYGGGEESAVNGGTTVTLNSGTIGTAGLGDAKHGNVFGGGNLGVVESSTNVTISGGSVNHSVYGGGCEADVLGNTNVEMTDGYIFNGIFGGGLSGSVGTFTRSTAEADVNVFGHTPHEGCIGRPMSCAENTGLCKVKVTGGQVGPIEVATEGMTRRGANGILDPVEEGWIWGGGRGLVQDPTVHKDTHFTAYVDSTDVTIGGDAFILESIIGGGEFGRVLHGTHVTIQDQCQIGVGYKQTENGKPKRYPEAKFIDPSTKTITDADTLAMCSCFDYGHDYNGDGKPEYLSFDQYYDKYYGSGVNVPAEFALGSTSHPSDGKTWIGMVFGGGSGYMPCEKEDGSGYEWVSSAGWVGGNTLVEIKGGHILTNVYGANEYTNVEGKSTVKMSGGTIGVPRTLKQIKKNPLNGNLFGAGKGDPRTHFNKMTNVASTEVEVTSGIIYGSVYGGGEDGHVIGNAVTTIGKETTSGEVITKTGPSIGCVSTAVNNGNVFGGGQGSSTALTAGVVGGNVTLNILGGSINGSVYGGGEIASVGTHFAMTTETNYGEMQDGNDHGNLTVNLTGGTIEQNVYGGCMGTTENDLLGLSKNVSVELNKDVNDAVQGCAVKGSIFGCNNVNSSPEGTATVHVYKTQRAGKSRITNGGDVTDAKVPGSKDSNGEFILNTFDLQAVYGGGNMAAYVPEAANGSTNVIIDGCSRTSIGQVYGGGNAASTPATNVEVNGTYEIGELFGGGNGKDAIDENTPNPGANVGYKDYHLVEDKPEFATKEARVNGDAFAEYRYGTGEATVNINGGTVYRVFGGSNTKGNVRKTALTILEEKTDNGDPICNLHIDEAYGGGKSAQMDAEAKLLMACIPGLKEVYGGAQAADVNDDVTLTITNGMFDRVFGGNNISGTIRGKITVNIEETGCRPVIIGELYGGGNLAAYSIYGYKQVNEGTTDEPDLKWKPRESADDEGSGPTDPYDDPQVNVKSFTSIGAVYGGGYGAGAVMVGSPHVNINVVHGENENFTYENDKSTYKNSDNQDVPYYDAKGFKELTKTIDGHPVTLPKHDKGTIGAIGKVFGGGNAAQVIGNTDVNIGTETGNEINMVSLPVNDSTGKEPTADGWIPTYEKKEVIGADIRGNVYGGGNQAEVTGSTDVQIGKETTTTSPSSPAPTQETTDEP